MIVVLAIVAVLAGMAAPHAQKILQREKELTLRATLRDARQAIDRFHADWRIAKGGAGFGAAASPDGYPVSFDVLVEGVDGVGPAGGGKRRYLRQVPRNPFSPPAAPAEDQWRLLAYQDDPKAPPRSGVGKDIYDLRPNTQHTALDGTTYADW